MIDILLYVFLYIISCIPIILFLHKYMETEKIRIICLLFIIYSIPFFTVVFIIFCVLYPLCEQSYRILLYYRYKKAIKIFKGALFMKLSKELESIYLAEQYSALEHFIGLEYLDKQLKNNQLYESQILSIIGEYLE
jgi:hypothetical protein